MICHFMCVSQTVTVFETRSSILRFDDFVYLFRERFENMILDRHLWKIRKTIYKKHKRYESVFDSFCSEYSMGRTYTAVDFIPRSEIFKINSFFFKIRKKLLISKIHPMINVAKLCKEKNCKIEIIVNEALFDSIWIDWMSIRIRQCQPIICNYEN